MRNGIVKNRGHAVKCAFPLKYKKIASVVGRGQDPRHDLEWLLCFEVQICKHVGISSNFPKEHPRPQLQVLKFIH